MAMIINGHGKALRRDCNGDSPIGFMGTGRGMTLCAWAKKTATPSWWACPFYASVGEGGGSGNSAGIGLSYLTPWTRLNLMTAIGERDTGYDVSNDQWIFFALTSSDSAYGFTVWWGLEGASSLSSYSTTDFDLGTTVGRYLTAGCNNDLLTGNTNYWPGKIYGFRAWSDQLVEADLLDELAYEVGSGAPAYRTSGLYLSWDCFDQTNGHTDRSGNGRNATVSSTSPTWDTDKPTFGASAAIKNFMLTGVGA